MKTAYRILKLKSGEDIITRIKGQDKNKLILERPMSFVTRIIMDPYTGRQKELTILKNWIPYTNEIQTKIPKDYIASFLTPDSEVIKLYDLEKEKEDVNYKKKNIIDMGNQQNQNELFEDNVDKLKSMFDFMKDFKTDDSFMDQIEDMLQPEETESPPSGNFKNYISLSIMLPPEALLSLVDADILDADDVQDLIDSLNNKDKKNNKDDKNYGNRWKDWPADLDDYLDDI